MSFHEVLFPLRLAFGSGGGPERRTDIVALASGHEERSSPWASSRRRYNVGFALSCLDDVHEVIAFFEARHGRLYGFRFRDAVDHRSSAPSIQPQATDQTLGLGDGVNGSFQLLKNYQSGGQSFQRSISKPVSGSVRVAVDSVEQVEGTAFTVDGTTGLVVFEAGFVPASSAVVAAGYLFDVPVRFDTDRLEVNLSAFSAGEIPDIPITELRLS